MALDFKSAYEKAAPSKDEIQGCQEEIFRSCISHLEDIATAYGLDEYQSELKELRERVENPELKIAIIGDFNTGKSTFINALLKDQTLSTAGIPTTVIPTYIRWNGSDAKPLITVKFFEDANEYDFQTDYALLKEKLGFE
ncbi:MAG: dynamin family protein, partial [Clostridia bacterium]|nr:dynamin family protein [Clostridia bacterium]